MTERTEAQYASALEAQGDILRRIRDERDAQATEIQRLNHRIAELEEAVEVLEERLKMATADDAARKIQSARLMDLEQQNAELLAALVESRNALQMANDTANGPINDTIWMMHGPETLFDFMDAAIASVKESK